MKRFSTHLMVAGLVALLAACNDATPTSPAAREQSALARRGAVANDGIGIWKDSVVGVIASNAQYGLFMPNVWNGDVVYYAHGFVAPQGPVFLPTADPDVAVLRDALGSMGYAVATSSFRENGYDFADGLQRMHQLRGLFTSKYGNAKRSLLVGHSLGGQIVQALAEGKPGQYDGALAMCGVVGGTALETNYMGQIRTVFDFFYPGVLPGNTIQMPEITDVNTQIIYPAYVAIMANTDGFGAMTVLDQTPMAGRNPAEMMQTLLSVLGLHALEANDLFGRTHGHALFGNDATVYSSSLLPPPVLDWLNAGVTRYTATPDARQWLAHNYQPTGKLSIPMVTLHLRHDWLVPYAHEIAYKQIVEAAGRSSMLSQHEAAGYGHCGAFTPEDTFGAFFELVAKVAAIKP